MIDLAIEQRMEDLPSKRARKYFLQQYSLRKRSTLVLSLPFALLFGGLEYSSLLPTPDRPRCGLSSRWNH